MSDPIHQRDNTQSTLVSLKFISYFNSHFYTSIVIVTHEPFAFTPRERGKYSQKVIHRVTGGLYLGDLAASGPVAVHKNKSVG